MIVYGDRSRREPAAAALQRLFELCAEAARDPGECGRLLIEVGVFVQGLLDRACAREQIDELSPQVAACGELLLRTGQAFARCMQAPTTCAVDRVRATLQALAVTGISGLLTLREPEGFAHYAVYPELYAQAASQLPAGEVQVIGVRSIGTSLCAAVAGALGRERLPWTVRPVGHPFARELHIGPRLSKVLLHAQDKTRYAIVDEGPGLSGSSFDAVFRWLTDRGVEPARIWLFPSHAGEPGSFGAPGVRERFRAANKCHVSFEAGLLGAGPDTGLATWFADLTGPALSPLEDVGGGSWRRHHFAHPEHYPASNVREERRKYLLRTRQRTWLLKFIGLGGHAPRLIARARALQDAGFSPELAAARRGFGLSPWLDDARPLSAAQYDRTLLVGRVADYLAFLKRSFPALAHDGARPAALLALARQNAGELLGPEPACELKRFEALLPELERQHATVETDNRLDAHEWLVLRDGRLLKTDALEHHAAHDCIGCQDLAWDVAGAAIELGLSDTERALLLAHLRDRAGARFSEPKLAFYELAYLAFRAGHAALGERALCEHAPEDAARLAAAKARYAAALAQRLGS